MATSFERLSTCKVRFTFDVDAAAFEEIFRKTVRTRSAKILIPGFRKGKAPMNVVLQHYGTKGFLEEAFNEYAQAEFTNALKEYNIYPLERPEPKDVVCERGKNMSFVLEVVCEPEPELGAYTGHGIVKTVAEVTDDDVQAQILRVIDRQARWVEVTDRPAKIGDQVNINYSGFVDDVQFEGGTAEKQDLVLGDGRFIPGYEEQLVGAEVESDVDVNVTFPDPYSKAELAGKPAVFHVHVNAIREKDAPELDDDFVKDVSTKSNTVEEYKAEIRAQLEKAADRKADQEFQREFIEKLVENSVCEVPEAMVKEAFQNELQQQEYNIMMQTNGMTLDMALEQRGMTRESWYEDSKAGIEEDIKDRLCWDALVKKLDFTVEDSEVDDVIRDYYNQDDDSPEAFDELKKNVNEEMMNYFRNIALNNKVLKYLEENA